MTAEQRAEQLADLVRAVRAHAKAHYEYDGWDVVVECYEDSDIREDIGDATTEAEAIAAVAEMAKLQNERRDEALCDSGEHVQCDTCKHWRGRDYVNSQGDCEACVRGERECG